MAFIYNEIFDHPLISESGVLPIRRGSCHPQLRMTDPAFGGMTDFTKSRPLSVAPQRAIDEALADMRSFAVRALLVVSGNDVIGLVTSYDIERATGDSRLHARVRDVMTAWADMPTVDWVTMQSATVADLLDIFGGVGVMHLVVVEGGNEARAPVVRGLVCRTRLESRLRLPT